MFPEITILGIDPSTDVTGVAVVRFDGRGTETPLAYAKFKGEAKGTDLKARFTRIRDIKRQMIGWIAGLDVALDKIAYEAAFWRGDAASEAIPQASGAYLTIAPLAGFDPIRVHGASVKAAYGNTLAGGKRETLKVNCIIWANETHNLTLSTNLDDCDDAIADALAVTRAAWRIWTKEWTKQQWEASEKQRKAELRKVNRRTKP